MFSLIGFFDPGFLPMETHIAPGINYYPLADGIAGFRDGLDGAAFYRPSSIVVFPTCDSTELIDACLDYIDTRPDIFVVPSDELRLSRVFNRLDRWWITFAQFHAGVPVEDGRVDFRIFGSGNMAFCGSNIISSFESARPTIDPAFAAHSACEAYGIEGETMRAALVYWPDYEKSTPVGALAWRVDIFEAPEKQWRCYISAKDGGQLFRYSLVNFYDVCGTASIEFLPKFYDDPIDTAIFQFGRMSIGSVTGEDTDAFGDYRISTYLTSNQPLRARLRGDWVIVYDTEGVDGLFEYWIRPPSEHDFVFSTEFADTDEVNLYYHTNYIHEYYEVLDPHMSALDYPVPARAGISSMPENAYWDGYGTNYGSGGSSMHNFALFANIIYHEYTHGITGWIYEGTYFPYSGQSGAINEAFSDYFAATNCDDPRIGYKTPTYGMIMFRSMNNNFRMHDDWTGEVHADGRIFGGALWDLRQSIVTSTADTIIHFTRYATPNTFDAFVPEALFTDDDDDIITNGSPNCVAIFNSFDKHGIGPGKFPQLDFSYEFEEIGDGDGFYESGESLVIVPKVIANGDFPWPDILSLEGAILFDGGISAHLSDTTVEFATTIAAGDTSIGTPITIDILLDGEAFNSQLIISFEAMNVESEIADTLEFVIGFPEILIIDDSPDLTGKNIKYYAAAIESFGGTYHAHRTMDGPLPECIDDFRLMIWFTGDDTAGVSICEDDTVVMASYLDSGGDMLLTGQNMTQQFSSAFLEDRFGAVHKGISGTIVVETMTDGGVFFGQSDIYLFGTDGANNQRKPTTISPIHGEAIARYSTGDTCAVVHRNGISSTALFGFGLEGVGGNTSSLQLPEMMALLCDWFGLTVNGIDNAEKPVDLEIISISPNPFNASCEIFMPKWASTLEIFDIGGRSVRSFDLNLSRSRILWDGRDLDGRDLPSGMFLVRCIGLDKTAYGKALLLR